MGLLVDVFQNGIIIASSAGGIGTMLIIALLVIWAIALIYESLKPIIDIFDGKFGFWDIFLIFLALFETVKILINGLIDFFKAFIKTLPLLVTIIECIWHVPSSTNPNKGMLNIFLDIIIELIEILMYLIYLIPLYLFLYFLGEILHSFF